MSAPGITGDVLSFCSSGGQGQCDYLIQNRVENESYATGGLPEETSSTLYVYRVKQACGTKTKQIGSQEQVTSRLLLGGNKLLKAWAKNQQGTEWVQSLGCYMSKSLVGKDTETWAMALLKQSRYRIRVDQEILSGYNNLDKYSYMTGRIGSLRCERCGEGEEVFLDFLCECAALAKQRLASLENAELKPEDSGELTVCMKR